jgi:hypothetical protein
MSRDNVGVKNEVPIATKFVKKSTLRETFQVSSIPRQPSHSSYSEIFTTNPRRTAKLSEYSKVPKVHSLDSPAKRLETRYDLGDVSLIVRSCDESLQYFRGESERGYELPSVPITMTY